MFYLKTNVSATLQQPLSMFVQKLQNIQTLNTNQIMKCTKVPGTVAHTYANKHVCIFTLARVALEWRVTLAKMAENSLKF